METIEKLEIEFSYQYCTIFSIICPITFCWQTKIFFYNFNTFLLIHRIFRSPLQLVDGQQNNRISLVRRAPRYNTPDIIVRLIRWPVDKRYRARLIQLVDVSRREPIPSTVLAVLPAFTFLPPAFKARFPRDFFSRTGYYAADNSGCQVKYDGDAFCEKLAIRFFRMGDIMRYYAEKVEGTWSGSAFFLYKCSSCLLWLPRQCTKQRILNLLRVFLYIPLYFESCDPHKSDS